MFHSKVRIYNIKMWWVHKHEIENHPVVFSGLGQLFLPHPEQFPQQILYSNITHLALGLVLSNEGITFNSWKFRNGDGGNNEKITSTRRL